MMGMSELTQIGTRLKTDLLWLTEAKYFDKVDSTQNRILQFLPKDGAGPVVIIAETQTKGVGRLGRPWVSLPGGIWFTLALPMKSMTLAQSASFSIVAALTVAKSLKEINNLDCDIKWPNDIQYEGKKIAGILSTTVTKFKKNWMLVGVGINVNNELPGDLLDLATTIARVRKQSQGRSRLIESVLSSLYTAWDEFDRTGFGPYQKAVEERLVGRGKSIQVKIGTKTVQGKMKSIDPQGNLLLESETGIKTVQAGEIVGTPA